jgi:hypothetical protein
MKDHLNRKKKCSKTLDAFQYNDDECDIISLVKKCDRTKNKFKCNYCLKSYCNNYVLDKHIKNYCKKKDENNIIINYDINDIDDINNIKNTYNNDNNFGNNNHNKIINNINNINNVNNVNNVNTTNIENQHNIINNIIIIPNMGNNIPVPFDREWITEHIDIHLKHLILLGNHKYTDLLKKILENKNNLNVIIDKDQNIGFVYNSDNTYKNMDKSEIVNLSMEKLKNELHRIKDDVINNSSIEADFTKEQASIIDNKYDMYKNDKQIQKSVEALLTDIYDKNKDEAIEFYNQLSIENNNNNPFGF